MRNKGIGVVGVNRRFDPYLTATYRLNGGKATQQATSKIHLIPMAVKLLRKRQVKSDITKDP